MFLKFILGIVVVSSSHCFGLELPSFIKTCYVSDPNLNKCLLEHSNAVLPTFSKGIPELGIGAIDPLYFDQINSSFDALKLMLMNSTLRGLGKAHISKFKYDVDKSAVSFKISYFPQMTGKYKISGNMLLINIDGEGDYVFNFGRTNCTVMYKHRFYTKENTRYADMQDAALKCNLGKGTMHFDNLFGGNKLLGDAINNFLNANFDTVMKEGSQPVINAINKRASDTLKVLYDKVPFDVILPKDKPVAT